MKVAAAALLGLGAAYKSLQIQANTTAVFDHAGSPFTQGLFVSNGCQESYLSRSLDKCVGQPQTASCYTKYLNECITLYETAGNYGSSELRVIRDFGSGKIAKQYKYPAHIFAEGGHIYAYETFDKNDEFVSSSPHKTPEYGPVPRILVGTWREGIVYDMRFRTERTPAHPTLQLPADAQPYIAGHIPISREVWGLTVDPIASHVYITSGGSASAVKYYLNKRDVTLSRLQSITLKCDGHIVRSVNELDWDPSTGLLWGNVWFSSKIYQFNPNSGQCVAVLDLHKTPELETYYRQAQKSLSNIDAVWNGIAILDNHWILFTGKLFRHIFVAKYT